MQFKPIASYMPQNSKQRNGKDMEKVNIQNLGFFSPNIILIKKKLLWRLHIPGVSLFQAFQAFRLFELIWTILEISANLMRKSYDLPPPPTPLPTLGGPKSLRICGFKVGFSKFSGGVPPDPPHI